MPVACARARPRPRAPRLRGGRLPRLCSAAGRPQRMPNGGAWPRDGPTRKRGANCRRPSLSLSASCDWLMRVLLPCFGPALPVRLSHSRKMASATCRAEHPPSPDPARAHHTPPGKRRQRRDSAATGPIGRSRAPLPGRASHASAGSVSVRGARGVSPHHFGRRSPDVSLLRVRSLRAGSQVSGVAARARRGAACVPPGAPPQPRGADPQSRFSTGRRLPPTVASRRRYC